MSKRNRKYPNFHPFTYLCNIINLIALTKKIQMKLGYFWLYVIVYHKFSINIGQFLYRKYQNFYNEVKFQKRFVIIYKNSLICRIHKKLRNSKLKVTKPLKIKIGNKLSIILHKRSNIILMIMYSTQTDQDRIAIQDNIKKLCRMLKNVFN